MTRNKQTIEVVTVSEERRRRWTTDEKAALVREPYEPGMSLSLVACRTRVILKLEHERGRVARLPTPVEIPLAEPTWRGDHIIRLLKERLGKLELEAPCHWTCVRDSTTETDDPAE